MQEQKAPAEDAGKPDEPITEKDARELSLSRKIIPLYWKWVDAGRPRRQ